MKKIIIVSILLLFTGIGVFAYNFVKLAPYYIYAKVIYKGMNSKYLSLTPSTYAELLPSEQLKKSISYKTPGDLYKKFKFGNFEMLVPIHHPTYKFIPKIGRYDEKNLPLLGFELIVPSYSAMNIRFMPTKKERVSFNIYSEKLFTIPPIKKNILKRGTFEVWRDLFRRDLSIGIDKRKYTSVYSYAKAISKIKKGNVLEDLSYNLYILYLRKIFFNGTDSKFTWFEKNGFGILDLTVKDDLLKREKVLFKNGEDIYSFILKTKKEDHAASEYRSILLNSIRFSLSEMEVSNDIYEDYRTLSYKRRIDQEGMIYLYMAWSHVRGNKNFLREMIQFLEKGKGNLIHIAPLYEYAFERYDTNFSKQEKNRKETSDELLKRKIHEENQKEIELENQKAKKNLKVIENERLIGPKQKLDYLLKKIKEQKKFKKSNQVIEID